MALSHTPMPAETVVAVGDPQTSLEQFLRILDLHSLLQADSSALKPGVHLITLGDYFDFGSSADRVHAASEGLRILRWLSAHSAEQVTLVAGNHDLARVGELISITSERFSDAQRDALRLYPGANARARF
jgi:UDP-2,3-diacylglucosamine pyrophosphatase LpxH